MGLSLSGLTVTGRISGKTEVDTPVDPFYANVTLLTHLDGANGATTFVDSGPSVRTITRVGSSELSTAQFKFGTASLSTPTNGTSSGFSFPCTWNGGTDSWTIEGQFYRSGANLVLAAAPANKFYVIYVGGIYYVGDGVQNPITVGIPAPANEWAAWSLVKNAAVYTLYINGSSIGTTSSALNTGAITTMTVGYHVTHPQYNTPAFYDEFRFTQGVARYTANYTPPTEAFPNS